jgi:hypothetical protein
VLLVLVLLLIPARYSSYLMSPPRYLAPVKDENKDLPRRRTGGGAIIHYRRTPSPPRDRLQLVKPKREAKEQTLSQEFKASALQMKVEEDPEDFLGQRIAKGASFDEADEFIESCLAAKHRQEEVERARRLGFFVDLEGGAARRTGCAAWRC